MAFQLFGEQQFLAAAIVTLLNPDASQDQRYEVAMALNEELPFDVQDYLNDTLDLNQPILTPLNAEDTFREERVAQIYRDLGIEYDADYGEVKPSHNFEAVLAPSGAFEDHGEETEAAAFIDKSEGGSGS